VSGLRRVREQLVAWEAPAADLPLPLVADAPIERGRRWWIPPPAFLGAAAALLMMGLAAGLANLEIRFGSDGLVIKTGWARAENNAAPGGASVAPNAQATTPTSAQAVSPGGTRAGTAPWRADLAALEQQLRQEFQPGRVAAVTPAATAARTAREVDPELLRQIQALIDESEVRQQRNLALRVAEVSRDFDLQRKADLVQIQQGLGRLEGRTDAEAARTRELVNYMMRVSQQQPPR
jgi:hypothetical protein